MLLLRTGIIENNENLYKTYQKENRSQTACIKKIRTYTGSMEATGYETYVMGG